MIDLKEWRTSRNLTQQQAADALGIGNSTVRAIEAGTREMTATLSLACHGWDAMHGRHDAATPEPDADGMADDSGPAWQASIDAINARISKLHQDAAKAFGEVHQRLQVLDMRTGKIAPTLSESDIGMIARRAARSVLPE